MKNVFKFKFKNNSFILFIAFVFIVILMGVAVIGSQYNQENRSKAAHPPPPTPTNIPTPTPTVKVNLALNKPATAISEESSAKGATKANDGLVTTLWVANDGAANNWWKVDLQALYNLNVVEMVFEDALNIWKYKIEVSEDNVKWITVVDKSANTDNSQTQTLQIAHTGTYVPGRYIKVTFTETPANKWTAIAEFRAYGVGPITTTPTPTPTNTPDCSATTKPKGDANCDGKITGLDYIVYLHTSCNPEGAQMCSDLRADFDGDKKVNLSDYKIWRDNTR